MMPPCITVLSRSLHEACANNGGLMEAAYLRLSGGKKPQRGRHGTAAMPPLGLIILGLRGGYIADNTKTIHPNTATMPRTCLKQYMSIA